MVEYNPCCTAPAEHWGLLPATRLASREILIEQNIKKRTGPALCVLCGYYTAHEEFQAICYLVKNFLATSFRSNSRLDNFVKLKKVKNR
jgi:hypothetical protein